MALESRWYDRNLSKVELVMALLLISIFIGTFSYRALKIFALAEQTSVMLTVNNINTVLKYRALLALSSNKIDELQAMEIINPMQLVSAGTDYHLKAGGELMDEVTRPFISTPATYVGELYEPDINDIAPGHWYFDRNINMLIYRVKNTEFFYSQLDGPERIRFKVTLEYEDFDNNGNFDPETDKFINVKIDSPDTFGWNI